MFLQSRTIVRVVVLAALIVPSAFAQDRIAQARRDLAAQKDLAYGDAARSNRIQPNAPPCPATAVVPPKTINGQLYPWSCTDLIGLHEDVYAVTVAAGQTLSVDYSSTAYDVFLYMYLGNGTSAPTNTVAYRFTDGISRETMNYTFASGGTFYVEAAALWLTATSSFPNTGPYTISFSLTGGSTGGCQANSQTLCLYGNRFAVSVAWKDHSTPPNTGNGQAVPVTSDSGYFWFFGSSNIELVVKVIDGRPLGGHWWVFYGSLTDVEFTMTVRDTNTGQVRTYFNQSGHMASVGDTGAF